MTIKELQKDSEKYINECKSKSELKDFSELTKLHNGSSIKVVGDFVKSEGSGQDYELKAKSIELLGDCPEDYPLQPKKHSME